MSSAEKPRLESEAVRTATSSYSQPTSSLEPPGDTQPGRVAMNAASATSDRGSLEMVDSGFGLNLYLPPPFLRPGRLEHTRAAAPE